MLAGIRVRWIMRHETFNIGVLILALLLTSLITSGPTPTVHATGLSPSCGQVISCVSISPTTTCCQSVNQTITVNVNVELTSGLSLSSFLVRVNYTNEFSISNSGVRHGVLQATNITYSNNIFSTHSAQLLSECINGIAPGLVNPGGCLNQTAGQVQLAQTILGTALNGPLSGPLFSITFRVTAPGTSTFIPDFTQLAYPAYDPSDPGYFSIQYIPVLRVAGVFANRGPVAFFNYQPNYPLDSVVSPFLLPYQPLYFDASDSFVANDSSTQINSYTWNLGDGASSSQSSPPHTYQLPGLYNVSLTVTDSKGQTDTTSREVSVLPALGSLSLTVDDRSGTPVVGGVLVRLFNTTYSSVPFSVQVINGVGQTTFRSLAPGNYYLSFSGPGWQNFSRTETVKPGWTTTDTIYMFGIPSAPNYSGLIYLGALLSGIGVVGGAFFYQKRKSSAQSAKRQNRPSKKSKRQ